MGTALKDFMILHSDRDVLSPAIERAVHSNIDAHQWEGPGLRTASRWCSSFACDKCTLGLNCLAALGEVVFCPRALQRQLTPPVPFPTNPLGLKTLQATPLDPSTAPLLKNLSLPKQTPQIPSVLSSRPPSE